MSREAGVMGAVLEKAGGICLLTRGGGGQFWGNCLESQKDIVLMNLCPLPTEPQPGASSCFLIQPSPEWVWTRETNPNPAHSRYQKSLKGWHIVWPDISQDWYLDLGYCIFFFNFLTSVNLGATIKHYYYFFNWRIIPSQCCVGFCWTTMWISYVLAC